MNGGPLFLGVDGGGTSTIAWLSDAEGVVLGRGSAGPSNIKSVGRVAAWSALETAIASAFIAADRPVEIIEAACLGLAGFDRPEDRALLQEWSDRSALARRLLLVNDGELVIAAGTPEGWGVGVIAGTGSIAVGRAPDGRTSRAGGWGHLIGDEGSAFGVAVRALRIVARRADGRDRTRLNPDPLTGRICEALGIEGPSQLVSVLYARPFDRASIASLARAVVAAAEDDPEINDRLLHPAGTELAKAVAAAARSLGWRDGPLPLALAGSFLVSTPAISGSLLLGLEQFGYQVQSESVEHPVRGALTLALRAARP